MDNVLQVYPCTLTMSDHRTRLAPPINGFMFRVGDNFVFRCLLLNDAILTAHQLGGLLMQQEVIDTLSENEEDRELFNLKREEHDEGRG